MTGDPSRLTKWVKGIHLHQHLLAVWTDTEINFIQLNESLKVKHFYSELSVDEDQIVDVMYNSKYNYFVVGTMLGNISVWKLTK